jgi:hypothetical protein
MHPSLLMATIWILARSDAASIRAGKKATSLLAGQRLVGVK